MWLCLAILYLEDTIAYLKVGETTTALCRLTALIDLLRAE